VAKMHLPDFEASSKPFSLTQSVEFGVPVFPQGYDGFQG
jgi:hypothetical protein